MGVLDQIKKMREKGMDNSQISTNLKEQGISPGAIQEGFNQEQIKKAVSPEQENYVGGNVPTPQGNTNDSQNFYAPKTQEANQMPMSSAPQLAQDNYYAPQPTQQYQEYYPQNSPSLEGYDEYSRVGNTDMVIEIAEQVFIEKAKKIEDKSKELNEFKTLAQAKIDNFSDRLKRIETIIDKLQAAILEKVGAYGNNLESIKKEMSMMQDSFGKMIEHKTKKHSTKTHSKK